MMDLAADSQSIGRRFWAYWMLGAIVSVVAYEIAMPLVNRVIDSPPLSDDKYICILRLVGPQVVIVDRALLAALFGFGQWLVLRKYLPRSGWWVVATLIGYAIPLSFDMLYPGSSRELGPVFIVLGIGLPLGMLQWLVLRHRVYQAGWWIVINIAGWALALASSDFVYLGGPYIDPTVMLLVFLPPIALAGAGMVWLLRRSAQRGPASALI